MNAPFTLLLVGLFSGGVSYLGYSDNILNSALDPLLDVDGLVEEKTKGHDVSIKFGSASGIVVQAPKQTDLDATKTAFAGNLVAVAYNMAFSRKVSMMVQAQLLLDSINAQAVRQGFGIGFAYHLFGGVRRKTENFNYATFVRRNKYNLSLVARVSLENYAASAKKATSEGISGSVFEVMTGAEFRIDISEGHALGLEGLTNAYTLPASVERLSPSVREFLVFWRFFI